MIDRVDRDDDGQLFVTDYKTGRGIGYQGLGDDPVDRGRHLQLPIYALAARAAFAASPDTTVHASYRFLDREGEELSVRLDEQTTDRFDDVLGVLVAGIESGAFPYHPGAADRSSFANCRFCDFDRLCPTNRATWWDRNRSHVALLAYGELADGPVVENDDKSEPDESEPTPRS
jgi:RecB family exonuclease